MTNDIEKVLFSANQIDLAVNKLAVKINEDYKDDKPIVLGLLTGCFIFISDIVRKLNISCQIDFMCVRSYGSGTVSTGSVNITKPMTMSPKGRKIIIMEDIIDSGITLSYVVKYLYEQGAADVKICTLLNKPSRRQVQVDITYSAFDIDNDFVVGYGMDYNNKYRNLPFIGVLKEEIYL